jgi:hypothetical protein
MSADDQSLVPLVQPLAITPENQWMTPDPVTGEWVDHGEPIAHMLEQLAAIDALRNMMTDDNLTIEGTDND